MSEFASTNLAIDGVKLKLDNKTILGGVSFKLNINPNMGHSIAIIGKSGAGKSVLLKCIMGILTPQEGTIKFNGTPLNARNKNLLFDRLGMVFQGSALFDSLCVWENIGFKYLYGSKKLSRNKIKRLADQTLEKVGLDHKCANQFPVELSGGMQKRVAIARAIITEPDILFFDEPTAGLDPVTSRNINALIRDLLSISKASALTITHDMKTVRSFAQDVFLMDDGLFVWSGNKNEMRSSSNAYIKEFLNT